MKITIIKSCLTVMLVSALMIVTADAQTTASSAPAAAGGHDIQKGPNGGVITPTNDNYSYEFVYNEGTKKIVIYFSDPDGKAVEAANLNGEVTFVNEDKSLSVVNSSYENKKFTVGVPDGKPLYMCGIVVTVGGQMYGGRFVNPSLVK